jgi:hypothetical protein
MTDSYSFVNSTTGQRERLYRDDVIVHGHLYPFSTMIIRAWILRLCSTQMLMAHVPNMMLENSMAKELWETVLFMDHGVR